VTRRLSRLRRSAWIRAALLLLPLGVASCGDPPIGPTPQSPTITCPADIEVDSPDDGPVAVPFATPIAQGGTPPVTVSCVPVAQSLFAVGTAPVTCTATDTRARTGTCTFRVRVRGVPRLQFTRFLAFGDSLTEGQLSPEGFSPGLSYPTKLQGLLAQRYRRQNISIVNAGVGGELASGVGRLRLRSAIISAQPEVLLLMEGTNDLFVYEQAGVSIGLTALEAMVAEARSMGIRVMLATIPPQRAGGLRRRDLVASLIPMFNDGVRAVAARQTATVVDVFGAVQPQLEQLIGPDDLHPNSQGTTVMAQRFFDVIRATFEVATPTFSRRYDR